jgi:hypothetical protein
MYIIYIYNTKMKPLSNFDIIKICKKLKIPLIDVVSKDELYKMHKFNGFYIVNMEDSNKGSGSHWCSIMKRGDVSIYFDSYGFPPPIAIMDFLRPSKIAYSSNDIQYLTSVLCGYFCISWMKYMQPYKNAGSKKLLEKYDQFINLFSENEKQNDNILKEILNIESSI